MRGPKTSLNCLAWRSTGSPQRLAWLSGAETRNLPQTFWTSSKLQIRTAGLPSSPSTRLPECRSERR